MFTHNRDRGDVQDVLAQVGLVDDLVVELYRRALVVKVVRSRDVEVEVEVEVRLLKGAVVVECPNEDLAVLGHYLLGVLVARAVLVTVLVGRESPNTDRAVLVVQPNDPEVLVDLVDALPLVLDLSNVGRAHTGAEATCPEGK